MIKKPARPILNTTAANASTIISILSMPVFGLCYLRVPTWCPFRLQFYCNGHNWLAHKLTKAAFPMFCKKTAFFALLTFKKLKPSATLSGLTNCIKPLTCLPADTVHPSLPMLLSYHWSIMQVEYATDIVFKKQADLHCLYEPLIRIATHSVKPENITSFLGQKLHLNYQGRGRQQLQYPYSRYENKAPDGCSVYQDV